MEALRGLYEVIVQRVDSRDVNIGCVVARCSSRVEADYWLEQKLESFRQKGFVTWKKKDTWHCLSAAERKPVKLKVFVQASPALEN